MPTGDELAQESKKREEERQKKIADKKIADKAADELGGISGQGVKAIRDAMERQRKLLDSL